MTNEQRARKIASLAWEIQPKFRSQFRTEEELASHLVSSSNDQILGVFLPICLLEVLASVETFKETLAHAELDAVEGESTVSSDQVAIAKAALEQMGPILPDLKRGIQSLIDPR